MSIFDLTPTPKFVNISPAANTALSGSSLIASAQTLDRGGMKWKAVYTYTNMRTADRAELMSLMTELEGQAHRLRVPVYDNPKQGAYGGTPLVDGASQTGYSINLKGCSNSVTDWIKRGDYFSIDVNGEHELKMATADATSGGTGLITVSFKPKLRASPLNNAAVFVEDGVLSKPRGIFVLESPEPDWSSVPGKRSTFVFSMIEDVFKTQ